MRTMQELLKDISDSIKSGKGDCGVSAALAEGKFNLAAGSVSAIGVGGGYIVSLGLSRERLRELRDEISALLGEGN